MMNNALDPLPFSSSGYITCHYMNRTSLLQIVRIANILNWYFERFIFPCQQLIFHALPEALLEVHSNEMAPASLVNHIPCTQLRCAKFINFPRVNKIMAD